MSWWLMQATGAGLEVISALIPHWALCFQICQDARSCCRKHPAPLMELARHQAFPIKMLRALDTESSKPPWVTSDGYLFTRAAKITTTLPLTPELDTLTSWISLHLGRMENLGIIENSVLWEQKPGRGPRIWLWFCNSVSATPKICFFAWYGESLCYNKSHQLWMQNQQSQGKQNDQGRLGKTLLLGEHLRLLKVQPVLCSDPFLCSSQSNVEVMTSFPEHWMVGFPVKSFSSSQSLTFSL